MTRKNWSVGQNVEQLQHPHFRLGCKNDTITLGNSLEVYFCKIKQQIPTLQQQQKNPE